MAATPRWGAIAASSRVIGALLSLARPWPRPLVSLVLARGPEALISAVSFELAQEGAEIGGAAAVGIGFAVSGLTYFVLDGLVERRRRSGAG